jgi:hypothetical protein
LVVLVGVVDVGAGVSDPAVGVVVALGAASRLALAALWRRRLRLRAGVASGVAAGGVAAAAAARCAALEAASRDSEASSAGRLGLALETLGDGPIAAPSATPTASIAAANAAVTRTDGACQ